MSLKGLVIRESEIYPEMKRAHFACCQCAHTVIVDLENARVKEPEKCQSCHQLKTFELMHNYCQFTDKQYIKIQELPELVSDGETPQSMSVLAYDSNVEQFRPGDRVEVVGIYRANPSKVDNTFGGLRGVFNTYIDLISTVILKENENRITSNTDFSDDQIRKFRNMAMRMDSDNFDMMIIPDLVNSFAPGIFGQS